jgi:PAS domain S-box-containing protein
MHKRPDRQPKSPKKPTASAPTPGVSAGELSPKRETKNAKLSRENADRYRAIVDTAVDAIIAFDRSGLVRAFNRAAEKIFGYEAEEAIGRNVDFLMPEAFQSWREDDPAARHETGERKIIGVGREVAGQRKDGATVPLDLSMAEWRDIDGQQCFTGIMRDVTERHRQARLLVDATEVAQQARIEAEGASEAKSEFLAVMSHEIRTPLTSITGFMDLLKRTEGLTSQQRRYIDLVQIANASLLAIVNDILDFSEVESGQMELRRCPFRISAVVEDAMVVVGPSAAAKNLPLKSVVNPNVPEWSMGDEARLRQVLVNLLANAVKFTRMGSITIDVRRQISADRGERIRFSVTDTGIGIAPDRQHRLFKKFSQADSSMGRKHGGTGLGLVICQQLVELMDGQIGIHSDVDQGSTVWFTASLPAVKPPATQLEIEAPVEDVGDARFKILVVDDIETNREIVEAYLRDNNYEVASVASAVDAIRLIQVERYDVVLMDIQMPVMDGVTATRCIRALPDSSKNIPIIAMTGNVLPQQVRTFLEAGMNDHVGKPIERAKLYSSVRRWVSRSGGHDVNVALN